MIDNFAHANRLATHMAESRGLATRSNPSSLRYWPIVADDEAGRRELARRIRNLLACDDSAFLADERVKWLAAWAAKELPT